MKDQITRVKDTNSKSTKNDSETAEVMNKAFNSVYVKETQISDLPTFNNDYNGDFISDIALSRGKLLKKMKKL